MEKLEAAGRIVIDDTAGHPESLAAAFEVAALMGRGRLLVGCVTRPGDVILLVGAHGMDEGARLLREAF
jgi:hypothetical protein